MKEAGKMIVQEEIEEILKKKMIAPLQNEPEQFVSSISIVPKKSSRFRPAINLKKLNSYVEYNHFKMERLTSFENEGNYLCKLDLKNTFFQCLFTKTLQVCKISMETEVVPISLPLRRTGFSTQSVYETHESSNCCTKTIKYTLILY